MAKPRTSEVLSSVALSRTVTELRDTTMAAFGLLHFSAAYFLSPITGDPKVGRVLTNMGFPEAWAKRYREGFQFVDPFPDFGLRSAQAFTWAQCKASGALTKAQLRYVDSLQAWDMLDGVGVPTYGPGARCGFVGIGRPTSQRARVAPDLFLLRIAAQTSFLRYCELIAAEAENEPQLSARELEVLQLLAEGRSSNAIALKLSVTPNTVETYVRRIFQKLMATDRTSAVLRGVARGLVVATDVVTDDAIRRRRRKEA